MKKPTERRGVRRPEGASGVRRERSGGGREEAAYIGTHFLFSLSSSET